MQLTNTDSIIFDLDGTLWDASNACAKAWNKSLDQAGINDHEVTDDFIRSVSGLRLDVVMDTHFGFIPADKLKVVLDFYKLNELEYMRIQGGNLYPDVRSTLLALKNEYRLFIVSNCLSGYIENFLQKNNLNEMIEDFECSGNTGRPKDENIQMIVKRNKLKSPVYVGDTIWDSEAAAKARIPFIYASYGFGSVKDSLVSIKNIADLTSILKPIPISSTE